MGNNENNLSDNIYKQLQELLNEYIIQWRQYKRIREYLYCTPTWLRNNDIHSKYYNELISYHELFSKDSWIMERVEWDTYVENDIAIWTEPFEGMHYIQWTNHKYHYMIMWDMTDEEKIKRFTSNAKLPTKSE